MSFTREQVVASARSYLDVRFRFRGRDRQGLDCVGLLWRVAQDIGMNWVKDMQDYGKDPEVEKINYVLDTYMTQGSLQDIKIGQITKLRQAIYPMHLGVVGKDPHGRLTIINANMRAHKVIEEPIGNWANLILSVHDPKGLSN